MHDFDLSQYDLCPPQLLRNAAPARLYEDAIRYDQAMLTASGAIAARSYDKTGRSPSDKRITRTPESTDIWWGPVNIPLEPASFAATRQRAIESLNRCARLYVVDGFAGWDLPYRLKIRVLCSRPYHALFMHNLLIRPSDVELREFGTPDYVIYNAGTFPADRSTEGVTSETSVSLNFETGEFVILGTQYAGEMKKGVFTIMNYLMPKRGVLSMHCAANVGRTADVTLFFGLSGTGKTTLSADPARQLIGDDEHCWTEGGVFNIEGGCYAKCIHLSSHGEPLLHDAIRFGAILENTVQDPVTRTVNFGDGSLTENTRAAFPIEHIPHAKIPCFGGHPKNIILLVCDAFGVLPPVSKLTPEQAMYYFLNGYTAKIAGTEVGVTEPQATFSACFGAAFLVWHPTRYAQLLAEKMTRHGATAWLVNTGWTGGAFGTGRRISLTHTRAIVDAIHSGTLDNVQTEPDPIFGLSVPTRCPGCPAELLIPSQTWEDPLEFERQACRLASLFQENFAQYADQAAPAIRAAGPRVSPPKTRPPVSRLASPK